ncbi:MAG: hypothetical protein ABFS16_14795 [Bacteroidota bacterium]
MRKYISNLLLFCLFAFIVSCNDDNVNSTGTVVFGANYHVINCISNVDVFIDGKHIGQLEVFADSVPDCSRNYGLRKELEIGNYDYKVEIRPPQGTGCTKDLFGELNITEGGCETVFIDYFKIDFSN